MSDSVEQDLGNGFSIRDPWFKLQPILMGETPDDIDDNFWQIDEDILVRKIDTERNLWELYVDREQVVTFDADAFVTTVDLGEYFTRCVEHKRMPDEKQPQHGLQTGGGSRSYQ